MADLKRAQQTANLLGYCDAKPEPRLREHNVGDWTGAQIADLMAKQPDAYAAWRAGTFAPEMVNSGTISKPVLPR